MTPAPRLARLTPRPDGFAGLGHVVSSPVCSLHKIVRCAPFRGDNFDGLDASGAGCLAIGVGLVDGISPTECIGVTSCLASPLTTPASWAPPSDTCWRPGRLPLHSEVLRNSTASG